MNRNTLHLCDQLGTCRISLEVGAVDCNRAISLFLMSYAPPEPWDQTLVLAPDDNKGPIATVHIGDAVHRSKDAWCRGGSKRMNSDTPADTICPNVHDGMLA